MSDDRQLFIDLAAAYKGNTSKYTQAISRAYQAAANRLATTVPPDTVPPTIANVRPFAASSPFNTKTPAGTQWFDTLVLRTHWYAALNFTPVFAKLSDPLWTFELPDFVWADGHRNRPARPFTGIHAPDNLAVGAGTDKVLMVVQPDGSYIEMWQAIVDRPNQRVYTNGPAGWATGNYLTGQGVGDMTNNAGVRAANYSWSAGLITPTDLANGVIDHALAVLLPAAMLNDRPNAYRPPATCWDNGQGCLGPIMMGSKIGIPAGVPAPAGLTPLGLLVFRAFQTYGGYVGDFIGADKPAIQIDARVPDTRPVWDLYAYWDHGGFADLDLMQPLMRVAGYQP